MSKHENIVTENFKVDGYSATIRQVYVPSVIDRDGRAFGDRLLPIVIKVEDEYGNSWEKKVQEIQWDAGRWGTGSSSFRIHNIIKEGGVIRLKGQHERHGSRYIQERIVSVTESGWSRMEQECNMEVIFTEENKS